MEPGKSHQTLFFLFIRTKLSGSESDKRDEEEYEPGSWQAEFITLSYKYLVMRLLPEYQCQRKSNVEV